MQVSAIRILNFLVNDMLDYAQLSAGQFRKFITKFNLIDSVSDIVNIMRFKADELGIEFKLDFEHFVQDPLQIMSSSQPISKYIRFDLQRLQQVLLNLVSNAIKFTPYGGQVIITGKLVRNIDQLSVPDESFISILHKKRNEVFLEIQVEDTGIGIKEEDKPKLF